MLLPATLSFLRQLKKNNHKEWFDAHRDAYQAARANFLETGQALIAALGRFDETVAHLQAKDCVFRINRDVRFSKNKAPYKSNMSIYICCAGKKADNAAGYYLQVEPGASFLAGGIWMPPPPVLAQIRQEIDYNLSDFSRLLGQKDFKKQFGQLETGEGVLLSRPPKGYDAENPAIEYLKLKSFIASCTLGDEVLQSSGMIKEVAARFRTLQPLVHFLNAATGHE